LGKQDIRLKELKQNFIEDFNIFMKQRFCLHSSIR